jgi:hypothetical protein
MMTIDEHVAIAESALEIWNGAPNRLKRTLVGRAASAITEAIRTERERQRTYITAVERLERTIERGIETCPVHGVLKLRACVVNGNPHEESFQGCDAASKWRGELDVALADLKQLKVNAET